MLHRPTYRIAMVPCILLTMALAVCTPANAHHILGVPHYAYDEEYPQTPVLTYSVNTGPHQVRMTGYPGMPNPGDACSLHVYISDASDDVPFDSTVTMTVLRERFFGKGSVVYGPVEAQLEEAMYKFHPRFEEEANYLVRIEYQAEGVPWIIDLPMVAGDPGSPWAVVLGVAGAATAFLIVIRAIRIKMARRRRLEERDQGTRLGGVDVPGNMSRDLGS